MAEVILASASPRRRHLLAVLGLPFQAIDVGVDETPFPDESPAALATRLAQAKAAAGACQFPGTVVLGADTVVAVGEESIGKPGSTEEAIRTLQRLRAGEHRVMTAVAAARLEPGGAEARLSTRREPGDAEVRTWTHLAVTRVWMRPYTVDEVHAYVATGDPFDKAGSYAVQHPGFRPVARIDGCFLTVVGLPLPEVAIVLQEAGLTLPPVDMARLRAACPGCIDEADLAALANACREDLTP
jgi:septum formation protein